MNKIESEYFNKESVGDMGFPAEETVELFFEKVLNLKSRNATPEEERGIKDEKNRFNPLKTIDRVIYKDSKPALSLRITTATDSAVRAKKISEISDKPFVRLDEMKKEDVPIPAPIAFLDAKKISEFIKDRDFSKHPELQKEIFKSVINSLKFIKTRTKNPKEIQKTDEIILWLENEESKIFPKSKSTTA